MGYCSIATRIVYARKLILIYLLGVDPELEALIYPLTSDFSRKQHFIMGDAYPLGDQKVGTSHFRLPSNIMFWRTVLWLRFCTQDKLRTRNVAFDVGNPPDWRNKIPTPPSRNSEWILGT